MEALGPEPTALKVTSIQLMAGSNLTSLAQDLSPGQDGKSAPPVSFGPYPFSASLAACRSQAEHIRSTKQGIRVGVDGKSASIGSERDGCE